MPDTKKIMTGLLFLSFTLFIPLQPSAGPAQYVSGEVLIKFKAGTPSADAEALHKTLKAVKKRDLAGIKTAPATAAVLC